MRKIDSEISRIVRQAATRDITFRKAGLDCVKVAVLKAFFEGTEGELSFPLRRESDEFDYGYALTVHKAQGSQWDDVMLFDESYAFREHRARWLYTGLTRAARKLTVVR